MRSRALLVAVVVAAALLGHGGHQFAQTTGGSSSNGSSNGNSNSNNSNGSSSSNNNGSSGNSNNGNSNSNSNSNNGTVVGNGTVPSNTSPANTTAGNTAAPTGPTGPPTTIAPNRVRTAAPADCPNGVNTSGVHCYRIDAKGNPGGARLPDGRVVVLPVGPSLNVDTGASTSNDYHQVIVVNNDNRVVNREAVGSRVSQWVLATLGLLLLVLVAAGVGALIFRAGLRQGRGGGTEKAE